LWEGALKTPRSKQKRILSLISFIAAIQVFTSSVFAFSSFTRQNSRDQEVTVTEAGSICSDGSCGSRSNNLEDLQQVIASSLEKSEYAGVCSNGGAITGGIQKTIDTVYIRSQLHILGADTCNQMCSSNNNYCDQIRQCNSECSRSKLAYLCKGSGDKARQANESLCRDQLGCSTFNGVSLQAREQYIYQSVKSVTDSDDFKSKYPELGRRDLAAHFTCLNLTKENPPLDPMNVVNGYCTSTAMGLGQVVNSSFLNTFGVTTPTAALKLSDMCVDLSLKKMKPNFRSEIWCQSVAPGKTIRDVFELSAFDPDIQIRSMVAVYMNHYLSAKRNWENGWAGYYGKGQYGGFYTSGQARKISECSARLTRLAAN
jgi:hypothetical protein